MSIDYKVGDKVERLNNDLVARGLRINVGDILTVKTVSKHSVYFEEIGLSGEPTYFRKVATKLHPHHDIIIAWLNGEEVEVRAKSSRVYVDLAKTPGKGQFPSFSLEAEYRIKPSNPNSDAIEAIRKEMEGLTKRLKDLESE